MYFRPYPHGSFQLPTMACRDNQIILSPNVKKFYFRAIVLAKLLW